MEATNIQEFYAEDDRRRSSEEVTFGLDWTLQGDETVRYGLHWVEGTGEIYVLRRPELPVDVSPSHGSYGFPLRAADDAYEVFVLGTADSRETLTDAIEGWESAMPRRNSVQWIRQRLYDATSKG